MAFIPNFQQDSGSYLPTTAVFDVARLYEVDVNSPEFKELLVRLYQAVNNISLVVNNKESSLYLQEIFLDSQQWFNTNADTLNNLRPNFRRVVNFGALPAAGTKSVPHGVPYTSTYTGTLIRCTATDPIALKQIPVPYVSATALANQLEINVDATNINITTGGTDYSAYTRTVVVLEFLTN